MERRKIECGHIHVPGAVQGDGAWVLCQKMLKDQARTMRETCGE